MFKLFEIYIYFFLILAFFLNCVANYIFFNRYKWNNKESETLQYLGDSSFAFVAIALILSIIRTFIIRKDKTELYKMCTLTFTLLSLFLYTYARWCETCQRTGSPTWDKADDDDNFSTASLAFISIAVVLVTYNTFKTISC